MSGKNKVYLALIALGLMALALDRLYFGATSPSLTSAADTNDSGDDEDNVTRPARRPVVAVSPVTAPTGVPELRFPRNLPAWDHGSDLRDIFARPGARSLVPSAVSGSGSGNVGAGRVGGDGIGREAFVAKHTLGALMVVEGLKIAVVSGQWLRIGDSLDSCRLVRIEGESAVFACQDGEAEFSLSRRRRKAQD